MALLKKHESPFMKIGIGVLALVVLLLLRATWSVYRKSVATEEKRNQAEQEITELSARRDFLQAENERLQTPEGMDEEIREQFGFADEGESVFIILDPPATTTVEVEEKGFWGWLTGLFGGDE